MSASPLVKTQFYLRFSQLLEIQRRSKLTGVPQTEIVRRLLASALAENN